VDDKKTAFPALEPIFYQLIELNCSQAPPEYQQNGNPRRDAPGLSNPILVPSQQFFADRIARYDKPLLITGLKEGAGFVVGDADVLTGSCVKAGGQARIKIRFVADDGNFEPSRRINRGNAHKPSLGKDKSRFYFFKKFKAGSVTPENLKEVRDVAYGEVTPKLSRGHPEVLNAVGFDNFFFHPIARTNPDKTVGEVLFKVIKNGKAGVNVPPCATTCESNDLQKVPLFFSLNLA
jgi:hypothetical protein